MIPPSRLSSWQTAWPFVRDVVLFVSGLAGIAYETLAAPAPNPSLLVLFAGMCGLPAVLKRDEK